MIEALGLVKSFEGTAAVQGLSFQVGRGEVLGLLGPNGAGKTTTLDMLTTLQPLDGGRATVAGFDVATQQRQVRRVIGLAGQSAAVDEMLTARENLRLFGWLYRLDRSTLARRVDEVVDRFGLAEFADRPASTFSGGERRRLDVAAALIADPPVVFLDEPTVGLDPRSRSALWQTVRDLAQQGTTIVLTTQYLEEADQLADQIVVVDRGRSVASGTPDELKSRIGADVLEVRVDDLAPLERMLSGVTGATLDHRRRTVDIPISGGSRQSLDLLDSFQAAGAQIEDFELRRPTLDDVFLTLTGAPARPTGEEAGR